MFLYNNILLLLLSLLGCNDSINPKTLISVNDIDELQVLRETYEGLIVGGAVTVGRLEDKLIKLKDTLPGNELVVYNYYFYLCSIKGEVFYCSY